MYSLNTRQTKQLQKQHYLKDKYCYEDPVIVIRYMISNNTLRQKYTLLLSCITDAKKISLNEYNKYNKILLLQWLGHAINI